jgi:putative transposase
MTKQAKKLKGVRIQLMPNGKQIEQIDMNINLRRFVKNQLLGMQKERYANGGNYQSKISMIYLLPVLKKEYPFLRLAESTCLEYAIEDVDSAYQRFFKKQNQAPNFESRKRPHNAYKSKCINHNIEVVDNHYIKLPKLGLVKAYGLDRVKGKIKFATVRKLPTGKYECTITVEYQTESLPKTQKQVGIDMGIADLAIQSDGFKLPNKNFERTSHKKLRLWQKKLSRRREQALAKIKQDDTLTLDDFKNYQKAKQMVAKLHRKIANQRNNYLHQYTTSLVKNYDLIAVEDLKVKNMQKNHHLARSIADASWAIIKSMLSYKCDWYGKQLVSVNPQYTSQQCSACGAMDGKKPLNIREWTCKSCGVHHDRDVNAATNILNKALA